MLMLCSNFGLLVFFEAPLFGPFSFRVTVLGVGLVAFLGGNWRCVFCRMKKTICTWGVLIQGVHKDRSDRALSSTSVLKMQRNTMIRTSEQSGPALA